jgi:hypothetical protein
VTDYHLWYGEKKKYDKNMDKIYLYTQESGLQMDRKSKELSHYTEENQKYSLPSEEKESTAF